MTKSYTQTFRLTTSLVDTVKTPKACIPQSTLATVCSVECGLFA
jgi:hypothetical protein